MARRLRLISLMMINWWFSMISLTLNVHWIIWEVIIVIWVKNKFSIDMFCFFRLFFNLIIKRNNSIWILSFLFTVFYYNNFIVGFLLFRCKILFFISMVIIQIDYFKIIQKAICLVELLLLFIVNDFSCFKILKLIQPGLSTMKAINFHFRFLESVLDCLSNIFLFFR